MEASTRLPIGVKPGHCGDVCYTTALPPKADVRPRSCYVAEVPTAAIAAVRRTEFMEFLAGAAAFTPA